MAWKQRLTLLGLLIALWIVLSGSYSLKPIIFIGAVLSMVLVVWVVGRMDDAVGRTTPRAELSHFLIHMPQYSWFLIGKVVSANIRVTKMVIFPSIQPQPRLLRMRVGPQTVLGKLILANSITLTPGTATLDLRAGEILVHALGSVSASSVANGEIDRELRRLEGHSGGPRVHPEASGVAADEAAEPEQIS